MSWKSQTYDLEYPITVDGAEIKAITIREPDTEALEIIDDLDLDGRTRKALAEFTAEQLAAMTKEEKDALTPLKIRDIRIIIQALSNQPESVIKKLHRDDLSNLGEISVPFALGEEESEDTASQSKKSSSSPSGGEQTETSSAPTSPTSSQPQ